MPSSKNRHSHNNAFNKEPKGQQGNSRAVSSNYTVDLFHHTFGASSEQAGQEWNPSKPGRPGKPKRGGKPKGHPHQKRNPHHLSAKPHHHEHRSATARKGYKIHDFELKDELYEKFVEKVKEADKTPKEVINQLLSFYNMGKIKI